LHCYAQEIWYMPLNAQWFMNFMLNRPMYNDEVKAFSTA
jgi:hypothetical protein